MDITMADDGDKENMATSPHENSYQDYGSHPPSTKKSRIPLATLQQTPASPVTQANSSLRRSPRLATLTNTPSRPSYHSQMRGIFSSYSPAQHGKMESVDAYTSYLRSNGHPPQKLLRSTTPVVLSGDERILLGSLGHVGKESSSQLDSDLPEDIPAPTSPQDSVMGDMIWHPSSSKAPDQDLDQAVAMKSRSSSPWSAPRATSTAHGQRGAPHAEGSLAHHMAQISTVLHIDTTTAYYDRTGSTQEYKSEVPDSFMWSSVSSASRLSDFSSPLDGAFPNHSRQDSGASGIPQQQSSAVSSTDMSSQAVMSDEHSSDAWTGDEMFMPPSARRRHREQRLTQRKAVVAFQSTLVASACSHQSNQPPTVKERPTSLRSSRPSRFQPVMHKAWRGRSPRKIAVHSPADYDRAVHNPSSNSGECADGERSASDADDEEESVCSES